MPHVALHFEMAPGTDKVQVQRAEEQLRQLLSGLESVQEVATRPEEMRFTGLEIVAAISATILIVKTSRELIDETRKLIATIKGLVGDIGFKGISVDVADKRVSIDELTDEHLKELTRED